MKPNITDGMGPTTPVIWILLQHYIRYTFPISYLYVFVSGTTSLLSDSVNLQELFLCHNITMCFIIEANEVSLACTGGQ